MSVPNGTVEGDAIVPSPACAFISDAHVNPDHHGTREVEMLNIPAVGVGVSAIAVASVLDILTRPVSRSLQY